MTQQKYDLATFRQRIQDTRDGIVANDDTDAHTIANAKRQCRDEGEAKLEGTIKAFTLCETKRHWPYGRIILHDGQDKAIIMIWAKDLQRQDERLLQPERAVSLWVEYNAEYATFSLCRGEMITAM